MSKGYMESCGHGPVAVWLTLIGNTNSKVGRGTLVLKTAVSASHRCIMSQESISQVLAL